LPNCQFTTKYDDHEIHNNVDFYCDEEPLASGFCIFHDKDYLHDKINNEEHKRKLVDRLKYKLNRAGSNKPILCIGFKLPDFSLSALSVTKEFIKPVYFSGSQFFGKAQFSEAKFEGIAYFNGAKFEEVNFTKTNFYRLATFVDSDFYGKTHFSGEFNGETKFNYVLFEGKEKVIFDTENLSNVSFMNADITGVRFSDQTRWGEEKAKEDRFKIVDERLLEKKIKEKYFNLGSIKAVYRSLRDNYEYRMRYDEAGQFFIREMELKRRYREVVSSTDDRFKVRVKQNNWFRRNLFSLTGWYYNLSRYGESLWRPTLAGVVIVFISTLFWSMQENPQLEPSLPIFQPVETNNVTSKFVGLDKFGESDHWLKASERSIADFIPLLPLGSDIQIGIIDFVIKLVGGAVTFGLILIALRRRFERRYRH
jgi:Pentapeptide repeats (9 copies)